MGTCSKTSKFRSLSKCPRSAVRGIVILSNAPGVTQNSCFLITTFKELTEVFYSVESAEDETLEADPNLERVDSMLGIREKACPVSRCLAFPGHVRRLFKSPLISSYQILPTI